MFSFVPFKIEHALSLSDQPMNHDTRPFFDQAKFLESYDSCSIIYKDEVVCCGGIIPYWEGRGQLWALFSETSKKNFLPVFRGIKWWLRQKVNTEYHRIELSVDHGFDLGKRRAELLGFNLEVERARKFLPNKGDCSLYSMVRE